LRSWKPEAGKYDLVVSHFVLDCFSTDEVELLVERVRPAMESGAMWVISEFAVPERGAVRGFSILLVGFLYCAFGLLTGLTIRRLPGYARILSERGFELVAQRERLFGVLRSELWRRS
jgi:hypothetical protein